MKLVFAIVLCFCSSDGIRTVLSQEIGEQCTTTSRERGVCMPQRDCVERENVSHHNDFDQCKLNSDGTPIICCVSNLSKSPTTKREQTSHNGGSNEVTSSDEGVETKFYIPKKKNTYPKQTYKPTSAGKNTYHDSEITFNTNSYHKSSNSFGDYDSYSPSPATFDTQNYYDQTQNRRPHPNSAGSKGSSTDYISQSTSSYGSRNDRPSIVVDGHRQTVAAGSQSGSSINSNKNTESPYSNRNSNKGAYDPGYNSNSYNRPSDNSNGYHPDSSSDSVYYPDGGNAQRPSSGNGFGNGDGVYYPDSGSSFENQNRPSSGGYRPGGSTSQQGNNNRPSNGDGYYNGGSQYENGGSNQNHRPTTTRRPSNYNEEPLWGTTERSTTRRVTNSGQRPTSSSYQQQKRISEQKCSDYSRIVTSTISAIPLAINGQATTHKFTDCQVQATSLVVGGSKAKLGEFPHMAALGFKSSSSITFNCGGTLISEEYVLTAAHCTHSSLGNPVVVRLGDLNLEEEDDGAQPQTVNVASVTVHPNYKPPQIYHDIALIKLGRKISFDKNLRPACLQVKREVDAEKVVASGWGSTNYGEISSDDLLKVGLDIIDSNQCNTLYGPDQKLPKGITSSIMCAGELSGKKDTCQGDSGGPLQVHDSKNKCIYYVIGITSSGKSCGVKNSPGLYTRVSEYVPWIESIVWKS